MQHLATSFYNPTKFNPHEKGIENYQTNGKETIAYKKLFTQIPFYGELDNKTGSGGIWEKEDSLRPLAAELKAGEFATVERMYSEIGMFDFTTRDNNKINSHADVAFIFRQLESEAVEHAFAVYIDKDSNPSVQWLSMGGINSTVIDPRIMVDAAQRLNAVRIYFVHNHPSGNLKPSSADLNIFEKLKRGFEPMGVSVNAIIINLNSGKYLIFDENSCSVEREGFSSFNFDYEDKVGVFSFNKQSFLQRPAETDIRSPSDAAQFLSQKRFSSGEKAGYLLLNNRNRIVANFFATQFTRNEAFKEVAGLVSKFGGVNVIAYTNKADINFYQDLKADLKNLDITLHDVIECESSPFVCQTFEKYISLSEKGLLDEHSRIDNINFEKSGIAAQPETSYQYQYREMGEAGESKSFLREQPGSFPPKIVTVVPLTQKQKDEMVQNPFYLAPHYGFPALNLEQFASVPDIIEGHPLNYQDKLILYNGQLQFQGEDTCYRIDENNAIVKLSNEANPISLTHADVGFNDLELTRQNFEKVLQINSGPPEGLNLEEVKTYYKIHKTKIMETQNTMAEEHLTSKDTEVNNNENYRQMNLDYLTNQIKFLGFGEGLRDRLSEEMNELKGTIDLPVTLSFFVAGNPVKNQDVDFTIRLNKGKESDMYFLNSYSAQLKGASEENNMSQKFYINKGKGITAKESFNLLSDRAINKNFTNKAGETYNAWVKLKPSEPGNEKNNRDFQIFSENYGFDLGKTLSAYPIKEMESHEGAERLMNSLKKGNLQAVTFVQNGKETSKFISANPQFKNLNVLNHDGTVMFHNSIVFDKKEDKNPNIQAGSAEYSEIKKASSSKVVNINDQKQEVKPTSEDKVTKKAKSTRMKR